MLEQGKPAMTYLFRDFAVVFSYSVVKNCNEGSVIPLCHKILTSPIYKKFSSTFYKHLPLPPLTKLRGAI